MNNHGSTRDASAKETAGWLEAAIAWEVCASLHRKFCKGKDALFSTRQADYVRHAEDARKKVQERPSTEEIAVENYKAKWDAELGRTAMKFVDRAGDLHPGIDDADRICADFYKAMCETIERMPHIQKMSHSSAREEKAPLTEAYEKLLEAAKESREAGQSLLSAQAKTLNGKSMPIDPSWVEPFEEAVERLYAAIDYVRAAQGQ